MNARVHYVAYRNERSGAYVFAPPDDPKELTYEEEDEYNENDESTQQPVYNGFEAPSEDRPLPPFPPRRPAPSAANAAEGRAAVVILVRGPLLSEVHCFPSRDRSRATRGPQHVVTRLYANAGERDALELETLVDLSRSLLDTDLAIRIDTDLRSRGRFFTDQNCFMVCAVSNVDRNCDFRMCLVLNNDVSLLQMKKRKVVPDFKVGGNYYPITCAAYIEDWQHRLTLLTRQAFGFSSLRSGAHFIFLLTSL